MVAHRSPKPPVRVRILLPLPYFSNMNLIFSIVISYVKIFYLLFFIEVIFIFKSFNYLYIFVCILTFFIVVFFVPSLKLGNFNYSSDNSEILAINPNGFVWPIPGYNKISSPFGKRNSPTSRCFLFSFWN